MKVWLVKPREDLPAHKDPWGPYARGDIVYGFVIRAKTENAARALANEYARDESDDITTPWLNEKYTVCKEITSDGPSEVILMDIHTDVF